MPIVRTGFKRTYYKQWEPTEGTNVKETLLMAHGLGASNNYYTALVPILTTAGYRCITYDLHGCGLSPYGGVEQSVPSLAKDAIDLMDVLALKTVTFVGHSMSGIVGPHLAATYPDRISALILVNPVWPNKQSGAVFEDRIRTVEKSGMEPLADAIPWMAVGSNATGLQRALIRELILRNDPYGYTSLCRVIVGALEHLPKYEDVHCPTLILAGAEDKNPTVKMCETILDALSSKNKEIKVLDSVGHWTCIEAPDQAGQAIKTFLDKTQKSVPKI
ncbi:alpha/beta-hydrolase [Myriangium duriaei CBS 260.36]|uniref:Alpha/beta-hydrolase n=1 Tax=Myriangium duriaei CBS 260.36 TaxID=1168546 RepID=A0A9P4J330_9PEZI|nr:alpha/beta-hydrolase [Myriangium duriaei CBS 260.36]